MAIVQHTPWTCGPATLLSVLRRYGLGPSSESTLCAAMHTTPEAGTPPEMMASTAKRLGLDCEPVYRMTIPAFERELIQGRTVIVCLQGHGSDKAMAAGSSGHWSAAFAMGRDWIYFLDPAAANGLSCLPRRELEARWKDRDGRGRVWNQFAVVVKGVQPTKHAEDAHGREHEPAGSSSAGQFAGGGSGGKAKGKPKAAPRKSAKDRKKTIAQAAKEISAKGYKLVGVAEYDLQSKTARYHVKGPDGTTRIMSSHQILDIANSKASG